MPLNDNIKRWNGIGILIPQRTLLYLSILLASSQAFNQRIKFGLQCTAAAIRYFIYTNIKFHINEIGSPRKIKRTQLDVCSRLSLQIGHDWRNKWSSLSDTWCNRKACRRCNGDIWRNVWISKRTFKSDRCIQFSHFTFNRSWRKVAETRKYRQSRMGANATVLRYYVSEFSNTC